MKIAGRKPRLLLATLLLDANQVVGSDELAEVLWPRSRPSSAVANLRTYVSSLRSIGVRIEARPSGYAIEVDTDGLDALRFEHLVDRARAARGGQDGFRDLREALGLWRGTPLSDLPGSALWDVRLRSLAQARLGAVEDLVTMKLARGEHAAAIDDLRELTVEHPYREDLWQRLILALHHSGRRAEALHAYTEIRRQLVEDLGIEPGQDLRDLHAAVLAGQPTPVMGTPDTGMTGAGVSGAGVPGEGIGPTEIGTAEIGTAGIGTAGIGTAGIGTAGSAGMAAADTGASELAARGAPAPGAAPGIAAAGVAPLEPTVPGSVRLGMNLPGIALPGTAAPEGAAPGTATTGLVTSGHSTAGLAAPVIATAGLAAPGLSTDGTAGPGIAANATGAGDMAVPGTAVAVIATPGSGAAELATPGSGAAELATPGIDAPEAGALGIGAAGITPEPATPGAGAHEAGVHVSATAGLATTGMAANGMGAPGVSVPGIAAPGAPVPGMAAPSVPVPVPGVAAAGVPVPGMGGMGGVTGMTAPQQLPADVPDFTGRAQAVKALTKALSPEHLRPEGPPAIAVVTGPPGVGKSALAVHCAHAVRPGYPEGQLYLCLGGTDATPADPGELLAEALRALGVSDAALPPTVRERASLYRSLLAERPMLVFLDDAADTAQVRPLLPGNGCAVLVTSRRRITELPGALHLELDVLRSTEAEELLAKIAGPQRVDLEREAAQAIVAACGHLPLAVRVAGARLAGRPDWSLSELRRRLADESNRLDELRAGDLEVRGSFELSYRRLPGDAAMAFRALGLLGPRSVPGWVADAVLDRHRSEAVVDALVDANLLRPAGTDPAGQPRYRLDDLIRCAAREKAGGDEERHALVRVLGGWLTAAEQATSGLPTTLFGLTPDAAPRWTPGGETLARLTAEPLPWLDAERGSLVDAVRLAADAGLAQSAWGLAATLVPYFDLHCRVDEWQTTHRVALESARAARDRHGEAAMLRGLAQVNLYQDRYAEADDMFRQARVIFRELADTRSEAISICGLGAVNQFSGRHFRALGSFRHALAMFLAIGDRSGEAYARQAIGRVYLSLRDTRQATRWLGEALGLAQELGDAHREGCVSMHLGRMYDLVAESERAMRCQGHALDIFEALGDRHCGAYAMRNLGGLQVARGERTDGSEQLQRSLTIFQQLGDRSGVADTYQTLSELYRSAGRSTLATHYQHQARELRRELTQAYA